MTTEVVKRLALQGERNCLFGNNVCCRSVWAVCPDGQKTIEPNRSKRTEDLVDRGAILSQELLAVLRLDGKPLDLRFFLAVEGGDR